MVTEKAFLSHSLSCRRQFLGSAWAATLALSSAPASADTTSSSGAAQPDTPNWNPSGFMRNVIERTAVVVA